MTEQCDRKLPVDRHNDGGGISRGIMSRGSVGRRRRAHRRNGADTSEDDDERSETRGTVNPSARYTQPASRSAAAEALAHRRVAHAEIGETPVAHAGRVGWRVLDPVRLDDRAGPDGRRRSRCRTRSSRPQVASAERRRSVRARKHDRGRAEKGCAVAEQTRAHLPEVHDRAADVRGRRPAWRTGRQPRHRARDADRPAARCSLRTSDSRWRRFCC